jgi:curved DNA-binding protein
MARDYYEALGVPRTADAAEIQRAFRTQARRYHPDVNSDPAAEERFKELNEAYSVLSDPKSRARYDRFGPDFRQIPEDMDERVGAGGFAGAGAGRGRGPFGGWSAPRGGPQGWTEPDFGSAGVSVEDLFGDLFGGRTGRGGGPMPGADQEAELTLSLIDAFRGGHRRVVLGAGDGERAYDVRIPAGVTDGQRIRLAGEGGRGRGGRAGDLYLRVRIAPDPRYRLVGRDIHTDLPVTPWEAALGATVPVTGPGGTTKVHVPPGTSTGRRLRLRGEGLPNARGAAGDLYAEVKVATPPSPTARERELFEELAAVSSFDPRRSG